MISRAFVRSAVHLVLFVLVVRLFSARRDRDHYFLAVIAFLMVLAAAVLTVDSTFLLAFVRIHVDGRGDVHPNGDAARLGERGRSSRRRTSPGASRRMGISLAKSDAGSGGVDRTGVRR